MIPTQCPNCNSVLKRSKKSLGKKSICNDCGNHFVVCHFEEDCQKSTTNETQSAIGNELPRHQADTLQLRQKLADTFDAMETSRFIDAIETFDSIVQDVPGSAEAETAQGFLAFADDEHEKAINHLTRAIERKPNDEIFRFMRGYLQYLLIVKAANSAADESVPLDDAENALADVEKAIDILPTARSYTLKSSILKNLDRQDDARDALKTAVKIDEEFSLAWLNLANLSCWESDFRQSIEYADRIISIGSWHDWLAYGLRGICHYELENYEQSISDLDRSINAVPDSHTTENSFANFLKRRAEFHIYQKANAEIAIHDLSRAIEIGETAELYFLLGFALFCNEKLDEALEQLIKSLELDDQVAITWLVSGFIFEQKQMFEQALNSLRHAKELGGELQELDESIERCERAFEDDDNIVIVKSPWKGTFYSKPNPEAPDYVKEGDLITPDTHVGIVEVMFAFNEISAGVSGKIVAVLVNNNEPIETKTPLFKVDTNQLPSGLENDTLQENKVEEDNGEWSESLTIDPQIGEQPQGYFDQSSDKHSNSTAIHSDSTGEQNRNRAPGELLSITGPDGWDSLNPYNSDGSPHYPNLFYGQAPVVKNRGFFTRLWEKMTNPNKCPFCNEHCGKEINRIVVDEYQDVQTRNIYVGPEVARITGSYYERRQVVVNNYRFQIHGACFECQKTWEYFSRESSIA